VSFDFAGKFSQIDDVFVSRFFYFGELIVAVAADHK
jgi:hypothetical protein